MKPMLLMLEHDEDDRYITQEVLNEIKSNVSLQFVHNSDEFFDYLNKSASIPSLILLDYNSTPLNASEVVRKLRKDKRFTHIPAVVVSGTVNPIILRDCYEAGANSFVVKPFTGEQTTSRIHNFVKYWFETVELPS